MFGDLPDAYVVTDTDGNRAIESHYSLPRAMGARSVLNAHETRNGRPATYVVTYQGKAVHGPVRLLGWPWEHD